MAAQDWWNCCKHCGCEDVDQTGHDDTCTFGCNDNTDIKKGKEIHSIWYRSLLEDGTLWCESSNLEEVRRMSADKKVIIQEHVSYIVYGSWNTIEESHEQG